MPDSPERSESTREQIVRDVLHRMLVQPDYIFLAMYQKLSIWAGDAEGRHPEARRCRLFHLLIGSTPDKFVDLFDLPGEDSIVKFAEGVLLPMTQPAARELRE